MKKEWADKWVAALRSGNYQQARGALRVETATGGDAFCNLGVLCDILKDRPEVQGKWTNNGFISNSDCHADRTILPSSVAAAAGMSSRTGRLPHMELSLLMLNDKLRTFTELAEIIEKNWEVL